MNKKGIILLLAMICMGCSSNTITIEDADGAKESIKTAPHFSAFELTDSPKYWPNIIHDAQDSLSELHKSITNTVDIVRVEPYMDKGGKAYNELGYILSQNQFEAIIYQDTLYLKFFQRGSSIELGVRVKAANQEFSTSFYKYSYSGPGVILPPSGVSIQPYSEVEEHVDSAFVANRQVLRLNKQSYQVGDSIFGDIVYEGRKSYGSKSPMQVSVLAKGSFKGSVKEGKAFTLTTPKAHQGVL
ncbi:hypothetical protein GCM10027443_09770 [Pontibacter brevis]